MKNKIILGSALIFFIASILFYLYARKNDLKGDVACTVNMNVFNEDLEFKGVFVQNYSNDTGVTVINGVIKKNGFIVGNVERQINVHFQRDNSLVKIVGLKISKKTNDTANFEDVAKLLPAFTYKVGGEVVYKMIQQNDKSFAVIRGNMLISYCAM